MEHLFKDSLGCSHCFYADADTARINVKKLLIVERLIDESHFSASLVECPECGDRVMIIFTEIID